MTTDADQFARMESILARFEQMEQRVKDAEDRAQRAEAAVHEQAAQVGQAGSIETAVAEFERQNLVEVPGAKMTGPCRVEVDGRECGQRWESPVHGFGGMRQHTWHEKPILKAEVVRGKYVRNVADGGVVEVPPAAAPPQPAVPCDQCEFSAASAFGLRAHQRQKHKETADAVQAES